LPFWEILNYVIHQIFPKKESDYIIIFLLWGCKIAFLGSLMPSKLPKKEVFDGLYQQAQHIVGWGF